MSVLCDFYHKSQWYGSAVKVLAARLPTRKWTWRLLCLREPGTESSNLLHAQPDLGPPKQNKCIKKFWKIYFNFSMYCRFFDNALASQSLEEKNLFLIYLHIFYPFVIFMEDSPTISNLFRSLGLVTCTANSMHFSPIKQRSSAYNIQFSELRVAFCPPSVTWTF